ncbi:hypothetical protein BS78_K276900, partial [Paspalum vaginatum]
MESSAVVSYAEGAAKALLGKIGLLLSEEYKLLRGVRGEVVLLRDDVAIMNSLLRMLAEADDGSVNHFVREWMKQVRKLAYDGEDNIDLFTRRICCIRPVHGALDHARQWWEMLHARHRLGCDIKDLRARALAISERRAMYGVGSHELRSSAYFVRRAPLTSRHIGLRAANSPNVGIESQVKTLSSRLDPVKNNPDSELKVFSIVGYGGLGKTTLALEVCRRLEDKFNCQAIVSVSQAFDASTDMGELLKRILQQVVKMKRENSTQETEAVGNLGQMDETTLTNKLSEHLKDKKYLILIDDVWTIQAWNAIQSRLPENNLNSRIIVTTRIEGVANACSPPVGKTKYIHKIKPLEIKDSEKLFVDRVFGCNATCPEELKPIMERILEKCGGLPLAIVSIASLLAGYTSPGSIQMWERFCNSMGFQMENNPTLEGMRQIITLSYNHLPQHLKTCMMYLSIFPEDYVIKKKRILYRWVAEGLVVEKRGLASVEVAEAYFDELMGMNMIDATNMRYDGAIRACRVHDIMLEVVVSKALEENFVTLVGGQCGGTSVDRFRRLSIQGDKHTIEGMDVKHVRSLSTFRPSGHSGILNRLAEITLLRVLDLEGCKDVQNHHMTHICQLFLLTFLSLRDTDVSEMPSEIGRLQHLQTLSLHGTSLKDLPESVTNLVKLEHLYFTNKHDFNTLWRLPRGLSKMKALRLARKVNLEDDEQVAKEIGNLAQLQDIEFVLHSDNQQVLDGLADSLSKTYSLRTLKVADHHPHSKKMNFLLKLTSPPPLLRSLRIQGRMDRFPDWIKSLKHLVTIKLVLCQLPNLMRIDIESQACCDKILVMSLELRVTPNPCYMPKQLMFIPRATPKIEMLVLRVNPSSLPNLGLEHLTSLKVVELMGFKSTNALHDTVRQLGEENNRRQKQGINQFK